MSLINKILTRCAFPRSLTLNHTVAPWRSIAEALGAGSSSSSTIFVGRLPPEASEDELKVHFPSCVAARIIKDKFSGVSKGFGYVDFRNHEDAAEALNSDVLIHGRQIVLDMAESLKPSELKETEEPSSTLFIGRLPYSLTKEELMELFPGSISARVIFDPITGISKGYGFVVYSSIEEAQEALKYNGMAIRGQRLNVNMATVTQTGEADEDTPRRGTSESSSTLFVKNLWYNTTEADLREKFEGCTKVRIPVEPSSDRNRGFGYVEFASVEDAQRVFDGPDNIELDGRILYLDYATDPNFDMPEKATDDTAEKVQRGSHEPSAKLFVRNLWYGTTEEDLKEKFEGCVRANVPVDPKSGSNKGYGFVEFNTVAEAQSVFEKPENIEMNGRVLYIDYSTAQEVKNEPDEFEGTIRRGHSEPSSTLFVQNLLFETTEDDLKKAFEGCVKTKIAVHQATNRSRGFGFVEYASVDEARAVFDKPENIVLDGRVLFIDYASRPIDEKPADFATRGASPATSILFVKNLWYGTTEEALMKAFSGCSSVRIPIELATGKNKGYGFVEYDNVEDAKSVFDKPDDIEVDGHTLFIDFATRRSSIGLGGGWDKEVDLNEGFYEGVRPPKRQGDSPEQDNIDDVDSVMAKSEDVK